MEIDRDTKLMSAKPAPTINLPKTLLLLIMLIGVGACTPAPADPTSDMPILLEEATLLPPTITPLQIPSATRTPRVRQTVLATFEGASSGEIADFATATPPDSPTPTDTATPTRTPRPTLSRTPTATRTLIPTRTQTPTLPPTFTLTFTPNASAPTTFGGGAPCNFIWFFVPTPATCPQSDPLGTPAAYQVMEGGIMIWLQNTRTVYSLYRNQVTPAWTQAVDTYQPGEAEGTYLPPVGYVAPQQQIGKVWRLDTTMQQRLGWGIGAEIRYTAFIQQDAVNGDIYLAGANGELFHLAADQSSWTQLD